MTAIGALAVASLTAQGNPAHGAGDPHQVDARRTAAVDAAKDKFGGKWRVRAVTFTNGGNEKHTLSRKGLLGLRALAGFRAQANVFFRPAADKPHRINSQPGYVWREGKRLRKAVAAWLSRNPRVSKTARHPVSLASLATIATAALVKLTGLDWATASKLVLGVLVSVGATAKVTKNRTQDKAAEALAGEFIKRMEALSQRPPTRPEYDNEGLESLTFGASAKSASTPKQEKISKKKLTADFQQLLRDR